MNGEFSGGTAASMKATMAALHSNPDLINVLINPHALCEGFLAFNKMTTLNQNMMKSLILG